MLSPSGRPAPPLDPRMVEAIVSWSISATPPVTTIAAYCENAAAPTPSTLPASNWNGVAALRTTSMTRDDFSSTTLIAIHVPYMITIMKMRIVIPNASMSCPTIAAVSPIGSVRAGSGQATANWAGANRPAWFSPATPRRSRRSAMAIALAPCHASVDARPLVSFVYSVNASSPAGDRSIESNAA